MTENSRGELVLSLSPAVRGYAFALFAGPLTPVDWGTKEVRGPEKNARSLEAAKRLIERHQPDVLVLEDHIADARRRRDRARRLLRLIKSHADSQALEVYTFTRSQVRQSFSGVGAVTKHEIAQAIASHVAEFEPLLPRPRKRWESEFERMGIFEAAALAITFYCQAGFRVDFAA